MADSRAGSWLHPLGGARAGSYVYAPLGAALEVDAQAVAAASGDITTGINAAGDAVSVASAAAAFTEWGAVTITAPYDGIGSIFDARYWVGALPQAGWIVYFDPANGFAIDSTGGASAAVNAGQWVVQVFDGSSYSIGIVEFIASDFIGDAFVAATSSGSIDSGIALAADALAAAIAAGGLLTSISLVGLAESVVAAAGDISVAIQLAGDAQSSASAVASLNGTVTELEGVAAALATAQAELLVGVNLLADAQAIATAIGTLSDAVVSLDAIAGAAYSLAAAGGDMTALGPVIYPPRGAAIPGRRHVMKGGNRPRILH